MYNSTTRPPRALIRVIQNISGWTWTCYH